MRVSLGEKHSNLLFLDGMSALQTALRAQLFSVSPGPRERKQLLGRTNYMKLLRNIACVLCRSRLSSAFFGFLMRISCLYLVGSLKLTIKAQISI